MVILVVNGVVAWVVMRDTDPVFAYAAAFSPDGSRIRFSLQDQANTSSLWEVRSDGSDLHQLLKGWHTPSTECCGRWTHDGRYYVFESGTATSNDIFTLPHALGIFPKNSPTPTQLTTGPLLYSTPFPDPRGRKIVVRGKQPRT